MSHIEFTKSENTKPDKIVNKSTMPVKESLDDTSVLSRLSEDEIADQEAVGRARKLSTEWEQSILG